VAALVPRRPAFIPLPAGEAGCRFSGGAGARRVLGVGGGLKAGSGLACHAVFRVAPLADISLADSSSTPPPPPCPQPLSLCTSTTTAGPARCAASPTPRPASAWSPAGAWLLHAFGGSSCSITCLTCG
jgi:hypothetical protein